MLWRSSLYFMVLLFSFLPRLCFAASVLPDVDGWLCGTLRETELDTLSGNHGLWQERLYRTEDGTSVRAILMKGEGPAIFTQMSPGTVETDGLFGSGAEYEVFEIDGRVAVLEKHPLSGFAFVFPLEGGVLTLESDSPGLSREALFNIASRIVTQMP